MGDHSQDRAAHQLLSPATPSQPIVALATASGRGAIGVVRVSGPDLMALARQLVSHDLSARHAHYGPFQDATGEAIDHGLAIYFPAPDSYTGEDVLELQGHGGPVVMQLLIQRVLQAGADRQLRLARPGEFTERAFLNGKLDLAQAEAVADLIDASSAQAARSASRSLAGEFSRVVNQLVSELIELRMLIEATLDFPEEEVDALARGDAQGRLGRLQQAVAGLLARASQGVLLRDGLRVVIAGPPNVGKSSLLNALAGAETAIVSPVAGTTRDKVTESILIDGVPINIVDTAGLRDTVDTVEQIGIERARAAIGQADVVLALNIAGQTASVAQDPAIALATGAGAHLLQVHNKVDQAGMGARAQAESQVWLSALTGEGIDLLRKQLLTLAGWQGAGEAQFIARERHLQALRDGQAHLLAADGAWRMGIELFAEELRLAQESLGQITGQFSADDLLGEIFSRFCICK